MHAWLDVVQPVPGPPGLPRVIYDEGVALPVRTIINMVGLGVTATDDAAHDQTVITIPGGAAAPVTSVFTRTGAIVAVAGDYTAAQVTNAVSVLGSYPDPVWIPSYAYSKLTGTPSSFPPSAHVHAAADVTSGVFAVARLGTGTPTASVYLRGDGQWATVPIPADAVTSVFGRTGVVVAQSGDYAVAQVTGAVPDTRTIIAGTGLSGGGALSGNVTLSANIAGIQTPWLQDINGANFKLNNAGRIQSNDYVESPAGKGFAGNLTFDGTNWRYIANGPGIHILPSTFGALPQIHAAPVGTAGAVATLTLRLSFLDNGSASFAGDVVCPSTVKGKVFYTDVGTDPGWDTASRIWTEGGFGARYDGYQHRFDVGSARTQVLRLESGGIIRMLLGGSLKALSVDGSGFVKAA
jgi:hypothetical protein